jgi:predicted acylesterase/phospholipase RssA/ABC-type phosphate/phosphonate transport system substrate-binding protein
MATMLSILLAALLTQSPADAAPDVRVGIVAFDDFRGEFDHIQSLLKQLGSTTEPPLSFRIAVGTYGDVAHWLKNDLIDVAVVSPGLYAESLARIIDGPPITVSPVYLASIGKPGSKTPWAVEQRRRPGYHDHYHAVCVVPTASPLRSSDDLKRAAQRGDLRFLSVHPLSVSSHIAPRFALQQIGVSPRNDQFEFMQSHTALLRELADASSQVNPTAGCVCGDDALRHVPELAESLRVIPFLELHQLNIPTDVVVARQGFAHADRLREALLGHTDNDGAHEFLDPQDLVRRYDEVRGWMQSIRLDELRASTDISLDEIGRLLVHHARTQSSPPRLALVLSGGGAKCSYQVGAVSAIEERLAEWRTEYPDVPLDISLVVGTSGGAINALPIALGISSTPEGRDDFLNVWAKLDQRRIVRPARIVRGNIGLWFAIFQAAVALWLIRRFVPQRERRGWVFGGVFAGLALFQILLRYLNFAPWSMLGHNHWLHHAWLWMSFGIGASAWSVLAIGLAVLAWQYRLRQRGDYIHTTVKRVTWLVAAFLLGLPFLQVITVLFFQDSLSGGEGIEQALSENFPTLIDRHLQRRGRTQLTVDNQWTHARRLQEVSRQVVSQRALERDLVITGSCLEQSGTSILPTDLYFHAPSRAKTAVPPFGPRGIPLADHPAILLDVVMGSGSIFPMFPARRLNDFPQAGSTVDLVDGGFAHNSPVEAAVLWGATHVIVIEASPSTRAERTNFLQNAAASFEHLYQQAQLQDARSRGKVSIFTLAPEPPHLCVLDFADNLIRYAAEKGRNDALGRPPHPGTTTSGQPRFRKELGEPIFANE